MDAPGSVKGLLTEGVIHRLAVHTAAVQGHVTVKEKNIARDCAVIREHDNTLNQSFTNELSLRTKRWYDTVVAQTTTSTATSKECKKCH